MFVFKLGTIVLHDIIVQVMEFVSYKGITQHLYKKEAHQRLYFPRWLKQAGLTTAVLVSFYRCVVASILASCVTVLYGH